MQVLFKIVLVGFIICIVGDPSSTRGEELIYAPAPVDNPLKGLVPYANPHGGRFPWSMEFNYFPMAAVMPAADRFDWSEVDAFIATAASRGRHAVFRIYLEYPERENVLPAWLIESGVKVTRWESPDGPVETPDYADARLVEALRSLIAAMGEKYDHDPRVGYITAGLLGIWGEWHNYPRGDDLWAPKSTQKAVMDAYATAFKRVPVLLRYPTGGEHYYASTVGRPFGYHDDSFAWATLPTGRAEDDWFFRKRIEVAGLEDVWKTHPIGGEIRPEVWGCVFDSPPCTPEGQSFADCVEQTHVTWLMDTGMNREVPTEDRYERAVNLVRRMGYEFSIRESDITVQGTQASIQLKVENRGVAPFYDELFTPEFMLLDTSRRGTTRPQSHRTSFKLTEVLPGEEPTEWNSTLSLKGLSPGTYKLLLGVPPTFEGGRYLKFANTTQDQDREGWVTVGEVTTGGGGVDPAND